MEYLVICLVTFVVAAVTLLSGFGLGTVLVPVFAIFFPIPLAISAVAIVHLLNNLFKAGLVGKFASRSVVLKFGIPAAITALVGALLLSYVAQLPSVYSTQLNGVQMNITVVGLMVGSIVMLSSLFELVPPLANLSVPARYIPLGGALSGFFGGLTGNQGILRAPFLIKAGLNTEQYVGTSAVCAIIVDIARVAVYGWAIYSQRFGQLQGIASLLVAASLAAFVGSYVGSKLAHRVAFRTIQILVGIMLLVLGFGIVLGIGFSSGMH